MRVIVHQQETIALVFDLESAARVLEAAKRRGNFRERNSQLRSERNDAERIADVVAAGNVQHGFAQFLASAVNTKDRGKILQIDVCSAVVRVWRKAERDRAGPCAANPRSMRIIRAIKNRAGCLIEQLGKDCFDRGQVRIKIQMFLLDI